MRKVIRGLLILFAFTMLIGMSAEAKETVKYTTPKQTALYDKKNGEEVMMVKRNTKLTIIRENVHWAKVQYKKEKYWVQTKWLHSSKCVKKYTARKFRRAGVLRWGGKKWTWYTQRILPGRGLHIPGRHLDKNGFVCDKDDYIVVAITRSARQKRLVVPTPFGKYGKCYDCGCGGSAWRDVYTAW